MLLWAAPVPTSLRVVCPCAPVCLHVYFKERWVQEGRWWGVADEEGSQLVPFIAVSVSFEMENARDLVSAFLFSRRCRNDAGSCFGCREELKQHQIGKCILKRGGWVGGGGGQRRRFRSKSHTRAVTQARCPVSQSGCLKWRRASACSR